MKARNEKLGVLLTMLAVAVGVSLCLQSVVFAGGQVYEFDQVHSSPNFKIRHFFTPVTGHFNDFSGTVEWNDADPAQSKVEVTIQAASIDTGNNKRDDHLRSPDFFDAAKFPTLTFKSTKVEKTAKASQFKVHGDFTMRGVTKPLVVDVEVLGFGDMGRMGKRGGFHASAKINRLEFGVSYDSGGTVLANEVEIDFPIEVMVPRPPDTAGKAKS